MVSLVFFDILQLPHTVISNSEKFTHPSVQCNSDGHAHTIKDILILCPHCQRLQTRAEIVIEYKDTMSA